MYKSVDDTDINPYNLPDDPDDQAVLKQLDLSTAKERTRTLSEHSSSSSSSSRSSSSLKLSSGQQEGQFSMQKTEQTTTTSTSTSVIRVTKQSTEQALEQKTSKEDRASSSPINSSQKQCWPSRLLVSGSGLAGGVVGEKLNFHVDARNGGSGELAVLCMGPERLAFCELIDHGNRTYTVRAKPEETGSHILKVEYEGEPVPGSPFNFPVTSYHILDNVTKTTNGNMKQIWPSRVLVSGSGLTGGVVGESLIFHVDARNGGPGVLTAYCTGPNRLAFCELTDRGNGSFTLTAIPEERGDHILEIKYGGQPVSGSPFTFPVKATTGPDASRVTVSGPGLEHGILSSFQSDFAVDTKGAGAGNLSIRMQGPKGAFRMEMRRLSPGDRKVFCHYNPRSTGVYVIIVKWSHVDVPGSPFRVKIFDYPDDLEKDTRKQTY